MNCWNVAYRCRILVNMAAAFSLLWLFSCSPAMDLEASRHFQDAQEIFNRATSSEDFLQSAALYQTILDKGIMSGAVLYNMGNAFMQADKRGLALAAYRQAKRYRPRDPFLDANLGFARNPETSQKESRSLLDHLLFWQTWLSYPEKFYSLLGAAVLSLCFALASLFLTHQHVWKRLKRVALIITLLLAFSAVYDWYRFDFLEHGVTIRGDVVARKGNSDTYEPAFTDALSEGSEFRVLERRGNWLLIHMVNGPEGWIRSEDAQCY